MSLLDRAKKIKTRINDTIEIDHEVEELVIAYFKGEVRGPQAIKALNISWSSFTVLANNVIKSLFIQKRIIFK